MPPEGTHLPPLPGPQAGNSVDSSSGGNLRQGCPSTSKLGVAAAVTIHLTKLLPLWFIYPCLLQPLLSIPFRAKSRARCAVLRLLRTQAGFGAQGATVAGMDEVRRGDVIGIVELGIEMAATAAVANPDPAGRGTPRSPAEVLERWPSNAAGIMLSLAMVPNRNFGSLIGLSWAFVDLHDAIFSSAAHQRLLSRASYEILSTIAKRERVCLSECVGELK